MISNREPILRSPSTCFSIFDIRYSIFGFLNQRPGTGKFIMADSKKYPYCFAKLEIVFPMGENGLRNTPESCFPCYCKTECLRKAMEGKEGLMVKEELVDRAYESGMIGFIRRWSEKKDFHRKIHSK